MSSKYSEILKWIDITGKDIDQLQGCNKNNALRSLLKVKKLVLGIKKEGSK